MAEETVVDVAATPVKTASPAKKKTAVKPKAKKAAPSHPPTATMVHNAILTLKEKGGSSLQAIKKYISSTYKVDAEKIAPFIKKYLVASVEKGSLIRTKGKGAAGSFKLAVSGTTEGKGKKSAPKKKAAASKAPKAKKIVKPKSPKKPAAKKIAAKPKPAKTPTKPKSTPKKAAVKPKTPKKATKTPNKSPKKATLKKAAAKKPKK